MREVVRKLSKEFNLSIDETELIISTLLNKPRFELYLDQGINNKLDNLLRLKLYQLKNGVPLEYITKQVQFFNYTLKIYPGVFIPRLETEYFVELIASLIDFKPLSICEIGTGCGAISIALAHMFPEANITATDVCPIALDNTRQNILSLNLSERIALIRADLFSSFSEGVFDLIVCNPPYVPAERISALPKSVRDFEPRKAIDGGRSGTHFIKQLIDNAKVLLKKDSGIALEIDEEHEQELHEYLRDRVAGYFFRKDLFGKTRYLFVGGFYNKGR